MSKPSQDIVKSAKKLHVLGVRKEPEVGDWVSLTLIVDGKKHEWFGIASQDFKNNMAFITHTEDVNKLCLTMPAVGKELFLVIPPLEWGLQWLRDAHQENNVFMEFDGDAWRVVFPMCDDNDEICGSDYNSHLAVLKAMIAVKESDK